MIHIKHCDSINYMQTKRIQSSYNTLSIKNIVILEFETPCGEPPAEYVYPLRDPLRGTQTPCGEPAGGI